ncbi:hypothetical protein TNCV_1553761 [Trichonephila clavipes]|nr:hypothetical protein TNCV_1553761 [Trichonephila clavipes]
MSTNIAIHQQNARFEKPRALFTNCPLQFQQGVTVPRWFQPPKSPLESKRFFRMQSPEFFLEEAYKAV